MLSTIPKGIVGGFEFTVLQRNLKIMAREAIDVCFRLLKERNKLKYVRQLQCQEKCIDHSPYYFTFRIIPCTFFPTAFHEIAVSMMREN